MVLPMIGALRDAGGCSQDGIEEFRNGLNGEENTDRASAVDSLPENEPIARMGGF